MSLRPINALEFQGDSKKLSTFERVKALWNPDIKAAEADTGATISIYEAIGEDFWNGGGMTSKRIAGALRAIGSKDVEVNINSYGGDVFEGIAIHNLLAAHPAKVTVNVVGIAASAASIIAMAGDEILMGDGAMLMVHNAWTMGVGNKGDFTQLAAQLEAIDGSLVDIYATKTGLDKAKISDLMDNETFMGAKEAIDLGFADGAMKADIVQAHQDNKIIAAIKEITGASNTQARALKAKLKDLDIVGDVEKSIEGDAETLVSADEIHALALKIKLGA